MNTEAEPLGSTPSSVESGPTTRPPRGWLWQLGADTVYALTALPIGIVSFTLIFSGLAVGLSLVWMVLGLPVLAVTAYVARGFAHAERFRLRHLQGRVATRPEYLVSTPTDGRLRRLTITSRDPQCWLDMGWSLVAFVTGLFAGLVAVVWWSVVLNGLTYWFWQQWLPRESGQEGIATLLGLGESRSAEVWVSAVAGLIALVLAPWVLRCAALVHGSVADVMLNGRAGLQAEVRRVTGGRDAARLGEADSLRRLERDIHDGPQQRMVRLAMDLARARQQLEHDTDAARVTLEVAYVQAREAIEELRALSRGIAPPVLVDRGLAPALAELLARQDLEVTLRADAESLQGLAGPVELCLYFVVAEAMTNVAKHARAERVTVAVGVVGGTAFAQVDDDGNGGAHPAKGSGLAGLEQRVRGLGGTLMVRSPVGGPTVVRADLPMSGL